MLSLLLLLKVMGAAVGLPPMRCTAEIASGKVEKHFHG